MRSQQLQLLLSRQHAGLYCVLFLRTLPSLSQNTHPSLVLHPKFLDPTQSPAHIQNELANIGLEPLHNPSHIVEGQPFAAPALLLQTLYRDGQQTGRYRIRLRTCTCLPFRRSSRFRSAFFEGTCERSFGPMPKAPIMFSAFFASGAVKMAPARSTSHRPSHRLGLSLFYLALPLRPPQVQEGQIGFHSGGG